MFRVRVVSQRYQNRKMIRATVGQAAEGAEAEMVRRKDVVQRPAQKEIVGAKGAVQSPPHAQVEQAAEALKQARGVRPDHEARHHHRPGLLAGFVAWSCEW